MDLKLIVDGLVPYAQPLAVSLFVLCVVTLLLRTRVVKRIFSVIEETVFENWQLGLLATTGLVLSLAAGWRTWEGMTNFTNEPFASAMITFGIQGIMLIVAWLIGESFATGMNMTSQSAGAGRINRPTQNILGAVIGLLLFIAAMVLLMQWTGHSDVRNATTEDLAWSHTGDKFLMFGTGLLMVALFALYAASDVVKPYIQGARVIVRNSMLWVMFLACMATSVFFSFDSFFTSIFPQSERVRAAELRAQNQVSGIVADIEQAVSAKRAAEADALFKTEAWANYEQQLTGIGKAAAASEGVIKQYINDQIESRRTAVKEQQERMASAQSGQAGLANRKISLTEEKGRLAAERPALATEFAEKKADVDEKQRAADAKRVEALAEDKGVEGSGKQGRGPLYRQRMSELSLLQASVKISEERFKDAQKRLNATETRLSTIDRELAMIDGDLAKLKGEAETAEQRIGLAEESAKADGGPKLDPTRLLPSFEQAISEFRAGPTVEKLTTVQRLCGDITGALAAAPSTQSMIEGMDCNPKTTADAAAGLFALQAGAATFESTCLGGDKLNANQGADALFGFARKCLADSALPSKETDELRTKINFIELSRDDKAHRFVVTWNAFNDGNRLAYLALAIAIGLDGLIFMSGLFGANAVRSPLSDVPTSKARSGAQLESTINAALGPHPYETAWLTLNTLRPMTNSDGFSALADLSAMERSAADRVRMVLTAGADIGAVETASLNPERYRVRSELREYLSTVCDKHFKSDATAKDRARLDQLVNAALAPHPREHAEIVLHTLEPIRETEGFTSMVTLSDIPNDYDNRVVRRVMNAGATIKAVAPDVKIDDRYYISPKLYEVLLTIRATAPESAHYEQDRYRFEGVQARPALDGGALRDAAASLPNEPRRPELERPARQLPHQQPLSAQEQQELISYYRETLLQQIGLDSGLVEKRLKQPAMRAAMLEAWKSLDNHGKRNLLLGIILRKFQSDQDKDLSAVYSQLLSEIGGDARKQPLLEAVYSQISSDLAVFMLFPETGLISYLIEEIERAAQHDDGLQEGEQALKDQLKFVQARMDSLNLADTRSWEEIRARLAANYGAGNSDFYKRFAPRNEGSDGNDV